MPDIEKPVVFLDRDGTLNIEKGYLKKLEDLILIPGAAESIKRLNKAGHSCCTNNKSVRRCSSNIIQNLISSIYITFARIC